MDTSCHVCSGGGYRQASDGTRRGGQRKRLAAGELDRNQNVKDTGEAQCLKISRYWENAFVSALFRAVLRVPAGASQDTGCGDIAAQALRCNLNSRTLMLPYHNRTVQSASNY